MTLDLKSERTFLKVLMNGNQENQETAKDKELQQLSNFIKQGYVPNSAGKGWAPYKNVLGSMTVSDTGLIMKDEKIVLPKTLWQAAVDKAHQGGHPGETRMKSRIRNHFWIPGLNAIVKEKVSTCQSCQIFTSKATKEPISPQRSTEQGWEEVSVDLFGPLPNKKRVLVVQDTMSQFPAATIVSSGCSSHQSA